MGHIRRAHLSEAKVVVPTEPVLKVAHDALHPIIERLIKNMLHSRTLTNFRDTLLPRLISGRLRLPEAQALATEACI